MRHLEIRLPVGGHTFCPCCHPERSEGSLYVRRAASALSAHACCHPERSEGSLYEPSQILRFAQDDKPSLQMSMTLSDLCVLKLYDSSRYRCFSDIAQIQLLQHLLLAQQELRHIKGSVQLLLLQLIAQIT